MSELLESDLLLEEFSKEVKEFWPIERELLALIVEILHSLLLVTLKANGAKKAPPPLRIPRPGSVTADTAAEPVSMGDYVRQFGTGK